MAGRDYTPPAEWGRTVTFGVFWAVLILLALPQLVLIGLWWAGRRLLTIPLALTVVGLAVIGFMGRPAVAAECDQVGLASYYGAEHHGRLTASGEPFNMHAMTAAHRTLPFNTMVRVCRVDTGACVTVRISDRGPFIAGRIIDLSRGAAARLGMIQHGVAQVCLSWQ
ncbi:MAG: septal ring lytic transglycosylase RlpA family protein [Bauldia sp.]|nr:septal ring lytic transglycosylase RlpA family protein [Bauldia sp.]